MLPVSCSIAACPFSAFGYLFDIEISWIILKHASIGKHHHKSWGAKLCSMVWVRVQGKALQPLSSPRTIQEILTTSDHCFILLLPWSYKPTCNRRNLEGTCPRMPAEPPDTHRFPASCFWRTSWHKGKDWQRTSKIWLVKGGLHHVIYIIISMAGVIPLLAFKFGFLFCPCSHIPCPQGLWFKELAKGRPFLWGFRWHSFSCTARRVRLECEAFRNSTTEWCCAMHGWVF